MNFLECELGFTFQNSKVIVFFGKATATQTDLQQKFPQLQFYFIKQTHSDIIIKASEQITEADAHYTDEINKALLIRTADCMPILIYNLLTGTAAAVHAGWRGVVNQITIKTLQILKSANAKSNDFQIWIGPHILQNSFEVEESVLKLILTSSPALDKKELYYESKNKFYVDLKQIVNSQINSVISSAVMQNYLDFDTKTNVKFHSFRRDKLESGRNLSFIAKLS